MPSQRWVSRFGEPDIVIVRRTIEADHWVVEDAEEGELVMTRDEIVGDYEVTA